MALSCPAGFDAQQLRADVSEMYARVAADPTGDFHFHRGPEYAAEFLGYDADSLASLPPESTRSFAGVGNPHSIGNRYEQCQPPTPPRYAPTSISLVTCQVTRPSS